MENVVVRTWSYDNNPHFLLDFSPGSHTHKGQSISLTKKVIF